MRSLLVDRQICKKWISRLCNLESFDPVVKKNRNFFFRYMLNVLRRDLEEKPKKDFLQAEDQVSFLCVRINEIVEFWF